jgi:hypothetical protein
MTKKSLPANPSITQIKKQAKELLRSVVAGNSESIARVVASHPSIDSSAAITDSFALRDAQAALAREYGFSGWHQLNTEVGNRMVDERDLHRWFGVQLNNGMWDSIEDDTFGPLSPLEDREEALYSAYASAYHWRNVGNHANWARGEHLISRIASNVGEAQTALRHGERCLELIVAHPDEMKDWDEPFAHEALARALASGGDLTSGQDHLDRARELTAAVAGTGDREVLEAELARGPWYGLS